MVQHPLEGQVRGQETTSHGTYHQKKNASPSQCVRLQQERRQRQSQLPPSQRPRPSGRNLRCSTPLTVLQVAQAQRRPLVRMTRPLGVHQILQIPPVAALTLIVVMIQVSPPSPVSAPARRLVPVPLQPLPHAVTANPASTVHTVRRVRRRSTDQRKSLGPKTRPRAGPRPGASACPFLRPRRPATRTGTRKTDELQERLPTLVLTPPQGSQTRSTEWMLRRNRFGVSYALQAWKRDCRQNILI